MTQTILRVLILLVAAGMLSGCRTSPVRDVEQQAFVSNINISSLEDVKNAISRAGASLGWQLQQIEPGHLVATLNIRAHMAQVDILYTTEHYSILYKDSRNLKYDDGKIHDNYNSWIQRLRNNINIQLTLP